MTATYERLDDIEGDRVRAYRRSLWCERAHRDPDGARQQITNALRVHSDPWVDGVKLVTIASVAFRDTTVGDLNTEQRYALIALLADGSAA